MASIIRQAWRYSLGGILGTVASLISFPMLTRLLSVEDYGLMSTVVLALAIVVTLGKLGLQKAAVRFYAAASASALPQAVLRFSGTLIYGMLSLGALAMAVWLLLLWLAPAAWLGEPAMRMLLLISAPLVLVRVGDSAYSNLLYSQERSGVLTIYNVAKRYAVLVIVVGALMLFPPNAKVFFLASIAAEGLALGGIAIVVTRQVAFRVGHISVPLLRSMVAFGAPMVGAELAWLLLSMGDRYVIHHLLGAGAVGIYAASYNMCDVIKQATLAALASAAVPAYMRIWEQQGRGATERLLAGYARVHFAAAFLIGALVSASAAPLITILASSKYVAGAGIVPWLMLSLSLESFVVIANAGAMLRKRTAVLLYCTVACALLNFGLNLVLVPVLGLIGSALANLAAFSALVAANIVLGRGELTVALPWRTLTSGVLLFGVSVAAAWQVSTGFLLADIALRSALVAALYLPGLWFADAALRQDLLARLPQWRERLRRRG
jgi:O-antigen/teichoic acid export membrane protein